MRSCLRLGPLFIAVVCVGFSTSLQAQTAEQGLSDKYTLTTWTERDGLPAGGIRTLVQDSDGYLWLGGVSGISRFDGARFVSWDTLGLPALPHSYVSSLLVSRDGSLWIGFIDGAGIARLRGGHLELYSDPADIGGTYAYSLMEDHSGSVWMVSQEGLHRFKDEHWERKGPTTGLPPGQATAVYEDKTHRLWVATRTGVFRRDDEAALFAQVDTIEEAPVLYSCFSEDDSGSVWMSDLHQAFRRVGAARGAPASGPHARGLGVWLRHDRGGNTWVATQGQGLWFLGRGEGGADAELRHVTTVNGLFNDRVQSILEDRQGNVWVGMASGLQRFTQRRVTAVTNLGDPLDTTETRDGSIWVATTNGLSRLSSAGIQHYGESEGIPNSRIVAVTTDETGTVLVVTVGGVVRFDGHAFSRVVFKGPEKLTRIGVVTSASGRLWFRDFARGYFSVTDGALVRLDTLPEAYHSSLTSAGDSSGTLWLGSGGQLAALQSNGELRTYALPIGDIYSIFPDHAGAIWIGGRLGLSRIAGGVLSTLSTQTGLPGHIGSIGEDTTGVLWFSTQRGIVRLDKEEFLRAASDLHYQIRYQLFDESDGTAGSPLIRSHSPTRSSDGRLWFLTGGGITIVAPQSFVGHGSPPAAKIEAIVAQNERFTPTSSLQLPSHTTQVEVDFTALDLTHPNRLRFRHRLDPVDNEWVDGKFDRHATYANLGPGRYAFRLIASNDNGALSDSEALLAFTIAPTFYQTRAFYELGIALTVIGLWVLWQARVKRVRGQFALVLAERIRVGRAIHDTLLQGLVGLSLQLEELTKRPSGPTRDSVTGLRKQVDEYIREARASIWELRSPTLDLGDLQTNLKNATEQLTAGHPVDFSFAVEGTPSTCSASTTRALRAIAREATNNAIRHGHPQAIQVRLLYRDSSVGIRVSDDGCGFDMTAEGDDKSHYGLLGIREQVEEMQGSLAIVSSPGRGTTIEASLPAEGRDHA